MCFQYKLVTRNMQLETIDPTPSQLNFDDPVVQRKKQNVSDARRAQTKQGGILTGTPARTPARPGSSLADTSVSSRSQPGFLRGRQFFLTNHLESILMFPSLTLTANRYYTTVWILYKELLNGLVHPPSSIFYVNAMTSSCIIH